MAKMYSRKHYNDIAETFRVHYNRFKRATTRHDFLAGKGQAIRELVNEFSDTFERDNPNFSPVRFKTAIYGVDFAEEASLR